MRSFHVRSLRARFLFLASSHCGICVPEQRELPGGMAPAAQLRCRSRFLLVARAFDFNSFETGCIRIRAAVLRRVDFALIPAN
jgi:hypothetical protein